MSPYWWLTLVVIPGVVLVFAPVIGAWWARDWRPVHCPRCRRELVGSPPEHRGQDREYCAWMAEREEA